MTSIPSRCGCVSTQGLGSSPGLYPGWFLMARFHSSGVGSGHHEESCVVLWNNQLYSGSCFGVEMPPKASSSFYDPHMPRQIHYFVLLFLLLLYLSSVNNAFMLRFFASSQFPPGFRVLPGWLIRTAASSPFICYSCSTISTTAKCSRYPIGTWTFDLQMESNLACSFPIKFWAGNKKGW